MFSLLIADHVRLDSEHIAQNYTIHARAAERFATRAFAGRLALAVLLAIAMAANVGNLLLQGRGYQIAAVAASAAALVGFALHATLALEARVSAHRAFAHRLWIACERSRALLAEMNDGLVDRSVLLARRDELIRDLHAIYEHGFALDQRAYESARLPPLPTERAA
jgi:hypothetical protein